MYLVCVLKLSLTNNANNVYELFEISNQMRTTDEASDHVTTTTVTVVTPYEQKAISQGKQLFIHVLCFFLEKH